MAEHAFEEMHWIAHAVGSLINLDPDLVEDIYRAAFSHQEPSDAPTSISSSRIFAFTSNRRQDFQGALYELASAYREFLEKAPLHATRALIFALEAYVAAEHASTGNAPADEGFDFEGRQAVIRMDYGFIWDSGLHVTHDTLTLLHTFDSYLRALSEDPGKARTRQQVLDVLVTQNRLAVIWRRLVLIGTAYPATFGLEIRCLAWARPILTSLDTTAAAGDFIRAIFGMLSGVEQERVERELMSIPLSTEDQLRDIAERARDRLLGCVPSELVVTDEARQRLAEMVPLGGPPRNEPLFQPVESFVEPYCEERYLADEGVPVEAEPNRRLLALTNPISTFSSKHLNSVPEVAEVEAILPALQELHQKLKEAEKDGVHPKQADQARGHLSEACERIAKIQNLSCTEAPGAFSREVLLEAANHPHPAHNADLDAQFDESSSWGGPSPRVSAAQGLMLLVRNSDCVDDATLAAIEHLSSEPVPAVRFQVASRLLSLYHTEQDLMWRIFERICREDPSTAVLTALLSNTASRLAGPHPERVVDLVQQVFARIAEGPGAQNVRRGCINIFTSLYLWQDNPRSKEVLSHITDEPGQFYEEAEQLLLNLREPMTVGPIEPAEPDKDDVRKRAIDLMVRVLESIRSKIKELENSLREVSLPNLPETKKEEAQHLGRLADSAGYQVYFASGAFDHESGGQGAPLRQVGALEKRRFFSELKPVLNILGSFGFPSVVHKLLETLEFLLEVDPRGVFLLIANVVRSGKAGGYQHEQLAAGLIVSLVERYLAEYRHILREDRQCREALIEILDTFVQWPTARRLTYRLDEIFR